MGREHRRMTLKIKKELGLTPPLSLSYIKRGKGELKGGKGNYEKVDSGFHWCHVRQQMMSKDVCIVEQTRRYKQCMAGEGCPHYKE